MTEFGQYLNTQPLNTEVPDTGEVPITERIGGKPISRRKFCQYVVGLAGTFTALALTESLDPTPVAFAQEPGETPLADLSRNDELHANIFADVEPKDHTGIFAIVGANALEHILEHVGIRQTNAQKPEYKASHCPQTAEAFLTQLLPEMLSNPNLFEKAQVSILNYPTKDGKLVQTYRIIIQTEGTTADGHPFKAIVSYLHTQPIRNKWGTVYVVDDANKLRQKGKLVENPAKKRTALQEANKILGNGADDLDPGNCNSPNSLQTEPARATAPSKDTESSAMLVSGLAMPVLIIGGTIALLKALRGSANIQQQATI